MLARTVRKTKSCGVRHVEITRARRKFFGNTGNPSSSPPSSPFSSIATTVWNTSSPQQDESSTTDVGMISTTTTTTTTMSPLQRSHSYNHNFFIHNRFNNSWRSNITTTTAALDDGWKRTFSTINRSSLPSSSSLSSWLPTTPHPYSLSGMRQYGSTSTTLMVSMPPNNGSSSAFQTTMHNVIRRAAFSSSSSSSSSITEKSSTTTTSGGTPPPLRSTAPPKIPVPSVSTAVSASDTVSMPMKVKDAMEAAARAIISFLLKIPGATWFYITNPTAFRERLVELKEAAKKEAHHYWMGTKLLVADLRTARQMMERTMGGSPLSRRERKQLLRTVSDLFRLVPMSMFVLIPFMEFALPFALRIFPNMLPSTFQDSLKAEENMKRELKMRIAMAQFFQETLHGLAKEQKKRAEDHLAATDDGEESNKLASRREDSAAAMLEFLERARKGEIIPPDVIIRFSSFFHDDLTLDNMPRMQLINMCKYMSIPPYGADSFLRFQLRNRIRTLKEDDQRILWEGIDSLTKMELREACQERGMRSTGLTKDAYKGSLQQWLELSVNQKVPIALLIMSRTFFLQDEIASPIPTDKDGSKSVAGLADAISGLDKEVVNEVVLQVATSEEQKSSSDVLKIKLEVLEQQNELIAEEQRERERKEMEAAAKKKENEEKEKLEASATVEEEEVAAKLMEPIDTPQTEALETPGKTEIVAGAPTGEMLEETRKEAEKEKEEAEEEEDEETELSSEEIEAISQLVSPDPVQNEREDLERLKTAMKSEEEEEEERQKEELVYPIEVEVTDKIVPDESGVTPTIASVEPMTSEEADKLAATLVAEMDASAAKEAEKATVVSSSIGVVSDGSEVIKEMDAPAEYASDEKLDRAIERLKSKVESMVGKIEVQLSDAELKIGDKLHFLDKDMDGILSREEMAQALQQVLKRNLTLEEAMDIAADMDDNEDGIFTIAELARWLETNKIIKLVEEGRDADVDRIIEKNSQRKDEGESSKDGQGTK